MRQLPQVIQEERRLTGISHQAAYKSDMALIMTCSTSFFSLLLLLAFALPAAAEDRELVDKGRYIFQLANCYACHTDVENDGADLAGGRALETDFGTFYTPNITPDQATGIGAWTDEQFITALTRGTAPDGRHYYPSFPYLSYRDMTEEDMLALKAYLFSQPAVSEPNKPHVLAWYLSQPTLVLWKYLNDWLGAGTAESTSRGDYLINTLGHCNECHTPRNRLGMLQMQHRLQGNESLSAPDISPTPAGIGNWSDEELTDLFRYGALPDGDYVADHMGEVVDYSTSQWSDEDLIEAIRYLRLKKN